jgi:hypothetical protein
MSGKRNNKIKIMPINLFSKSWNTIWKILPWILLIVVLWFVDALAIQNHHRLKSPDSRSSKGKFEHKKPHEPIYKDSIIIVASKTIYTNQSIKVNS